MMDGPAGDSPPSLTITEKIARLLGLDKAAAAELKDCPFCGATSASGEVLLVYHPGNKCYFIVVCGRCLARAGQNGYAEKYQAVAAWNRRV